MATAIQRRRGTSTQHSSFTGLAGEITIDTTNNTVIVHDGSTAGGHRLAKYTEVQAAATGDITAVTAGNGLTGGAASGAATLDIDPSYFDKTAGGTGFQANFEPQANNTFSLGALNNVWKDVYIGPGSLYVNGQQVISDSSGTIQVSADTNQNISIVTSGTGDIEFTSGGEIQFKSNVVLSSGKVITTAGGAATKFTSNVNMNSNNINNIDDPVQAQDAATKAYVDAQVQTKDALSELSGDTDDITEGASNLYFTNARADARVQAAIDTDVNFGSASDTLVPSQLAVKTYVDAQVDTADALSELSGDTDDITEGSTNLFYTDARADARVAAATDLVRTSTNQTIAGNKTFTGSTVFQGTLAADGSALTIADNLIELNSGTSGSPSENVGIIVDRGDSTDVQFRWNETNDNWEYTNNGSDYYPLVNLESFSVTDNGGDGSLSYNNGSGVFSYTGPSAAETRAHFSAGTGISISSGEISTTITQYADSDARSAVSVTDAGGDGSLAYNSSTGVITYTGPSASEVRAHFSAVDNGGDGSFSYSNGVFTYTGPSAAEVRAHFSAGTGITLNSGEISIGQAVSTTSDVTFGSAIISGNLTVNGTTTTVNSNTVNIGDNILVLNSDESGTPSQDAGFEIERGSSTNVSLLWDESEDEWTFGAYNVKASSFEGSLSGSVVGNVTGDVTGTVSDVSNHTTDDISEGSSNLYYTTARWDTKMAAADTDDLSEGSSNLYFTNARAQAQANTAIGNNTTDNLSEGASNLYFTNARARAAISVSGDLSYNSTTGVISFTNDAGDIESVTAGTGLTGGGTSGAVTLNVVGGTGIVANANDIAIDFSEFDTDSITEGSTNVFHTAERVQDIVGGQLVSNGSHTGISFTYDDAGDGAIDATVSLASFSTTNLSEGTNQYHTTERVQDVVGAQFATNGSHTGISFSYDDAGDGAIDATVSLASFSTSNLSEGSNQYFTNERVDDRVAALLTAGSGISLSYDDTNGTLTITGQVGDITGVTAGSGLTGGGTSGGVTLNVGAGTGITVNADDIAVNMGAFDTDDLSEGSSNLYHTTARARGAISASGDVSYNSTTGVISYTMPALAVSDFAGAAIQTSAEAFGDNDTSLMTSAAIQDKIQSFGYTTNVGDITGVTAGTGLSGGGTSGSVTLNVSGLTVAQFAGGSIQTGAESFSDSDSVLMTAAAVQDKILSYGYTTNVGDITGVTAGNGLTGGGSSGTPTLNVGAGSYITVAADTVSVNAATAATASTVAARDSSGNLTANIFNGTATAARYADLAEKYSGPEDLEPGDVVCFGGELEVEACEHEAHHAVAGVISTDPAFMMNKDADGHYVALCGRVPCKVSGPVAKGDLLVSSSVKGHAKADNNAAPGRIIGKAIGSSEGGEAVIEVLVNLM